MARTSVQKDSVKSINYLNKDFNDFKTNLVEFAKQYFLIHTMNSMKHHQVCYLLRWQLMSVMSYRII